jgi:hypothetical protein
MLIEISKFIFEHDLKVVKPFNAPGEAQNQGWRVIG